MARGSFGAVRLAAARLVVFPQKSPINSGSLAEKDLQLTASYAPWPPCRVTHTSDDSLDTHIAP